MNAQPDSWHFSRPAHADAYLQGFQLGLVSARGLFARRRMGKTEFLKHDLVPTAEKAGYVAAYTNLWDDADHPGQALASAMWLALEPKGLSKLWDGLNTPIKKIRTGGKLPMGAEASLELDLAEKEKLSIPAIQAALQAADKSKKKLLLVIDEVQVLAAPKHKNLARSLRAGLDIRKQGIKVLFAGSSESVLREMFSKASAPFYNWAPVEPFPLLGKEFVEAMVGQVQRLARQPLSLKDATKAFEALKETPEFFRWYIERYLLNQQLGAKHALETTLLRVHNDTAHVKTWKELSRADRAVLLLAAKGVQDLYGAAALKQLKVILDMPDVTATIPRTSLRRLAGQKLQLLARIDHGTYRFEDQEFQSWVATRNVVD